MKFEEAITVLRDGGKIRREIWPKAAYLTEYTSSISVKDTLSTDWEVISDEYPVICKHFGEEVVLIFHEQKFRSIEKAERWAKPKGMHVLGLIDLTTMTIVEKSK